MAIAPYRREYTQSQPPITLTDTPPAKRGRKPKVLPLPSDRLVAVLRAHPDGIEASELACAAAIEVNRIPHLLERDLLHRRVVVVAADGRYIWHLREQPAETVEEENEAPPADEATCLGAGANAKINAELIEHHDGDEEPSASAEPPAVETAERPVERMMAVLRAHPQGLLSAQIAELADVKLDSVAATLIYRVRAGELSRKRAGRTFKWRIKTTAGRESAAHPAVSAAHPAVSAAHPAVSAAHPAESAAHPAESAAHPAESAAHPAESAAHPAESAAHPAESDPVDTALTVLVAKKPAPAGELLSDPARQAERLRMLADWPEFRGGAAPVAIWLRALADELETSLLRP